MITLVNWLWNIAKKIKILIESFKFTAAEDYCKSHNRNHGLKLL